MGGLRKFKKLDTKTNAGEKTKKVSSPGQIFLFGEHAVVYGQPALATAINIRTDAEIESTENNEVEIKSEGIGGVTGEASEKNGEWSIEKISGDSEKLQFVIRAIELTFNYLNTGSGFELRIDSELIPGSGLGSSSAVTTATVAAVSSILGEKLDKEEITHLAYKTEETVQGAASRTGVNVATYGGFLKIKGEETIPLSNIPELKVLIGYTGKYGNTGELVRNVRELRGSKPDLINPIIKAIGDTTEAGTKALREKNLEKVGALMNANQNLLEGLRVSSPELRNLIKAARSSNALGAKLTGAGGGGCMIALSPNNDIEKIAKAIEEEGGEPIKAKVGVEGLRY